MKQSRDRQEHSGELQDKVLFVNRCSKVVKGGRKFSFSALILVGDRNGHVGYGFAKANELADAIRKGTDLAKRNLISFEREEGTIPHEVSVQADGVKLLLKPARDGTGIVAGSVIRSVLVAAGLVNVVAKNLGSTNPLNQVRAVFGALEQLRSRKEIMSTRGQIHDSSDIE